MKHTLRLLSIGVVIAASVLSFGQGAHAKITSAQARKIALAKYPGKVVGKVELENEEGTWQYSVMVRSGKKLREVMVNAKTGKIDNVEVTTAAKEAKEKAEEKHKGH